LGTQYLHKQAQHHNSFSLYRDNIFSIHQSINMIANINNTCASERNPQPPAGEGGFFYGCTVQRNPQPTAGEGGFFYGCTIQRSE